MNVAAAFKSVTKNVNNVIRSGNIKNKEAISIVTNEVDSIAEALMEIIAEQKKTNEKIDKLNTKVIVLFFISVGVIFGAPFLPQLVALVISLI